MFKPEGSDSKWVPVKKITWSFYGKAVKSSRGWKAADDPDPAYESKQETQECHDHPLWKASTEDESDDYYPCQ